jgi:predicted ArsR family transcriptional regulator
MRVSWKPAELFAPSASGTRPAWLAVPSVLAISIGSGTSGAAGIACEFCANRVANPASGPIGFRITIVTEISVIAVLEDPVRRRLYDYVAAQGDGISRAEAAAATGIGRTLAAFHLDRLAEAGLVEVTFARPGGRSGPGAGRPAKLYRRAMAEHQVSIPPRDYRAAAELLAEVVDMTGAEPELQRAARSRGGAAGRAARQQSPALPDGDLVTGALAAQGYQPYRDGRDVRLRNCPFHLLADRHPPLICGMNLALLEGLLSGAVVTGLSARLDPRPGECCVVLEDSKNNNH